MKYEYVYSSNQYVPRKKINSPRIGKYAILGVAIFLIGFFFTAIVHKVFFGGTSVNNKPVNDSVSPLGTFSNLINPSQLPEIIEKELEGADGIYAVGIKNLQTGEEYFLNEQKVFDSASLYKLWVMATVFQQMESGKLSPDKQVSYDIAEINERFDLATESAELTEGTYNSTIKGALAQMITISHNYAALSLTLEVGLSQVANFLQDFNFIHSSTKSPPKTTTSDIVLFYEKLYKGELVSPAYTEQMLELLKAQQINDRIPKYLPEDTVVAHKTGELGLVKHDAGIVYTDHGDYIIVLMSETKSPVAAAEKEAQISKAVYEYFEKR